MTDAEAQRLWRHLLAECDRMRVQSMAPGWREQIRWVLHPWWRALLWQLLDGSCRPVVQLGYGGEDLLLGIRMLCGTGYAEPRLVYAPQEGLPGRITARSLTWKELMA